MAAHQAFQGSLRERSQEITLVGAQDQRQKGSCCGRQEWRVAVRAHVRQMAPKRKPSSSLCVSSPASPGSDTWQEMDGWNLKEGDRALFVYMVPLILWPHLPQLSEGT